ncbi:hypothetical protein ACIRQF_07265 [Streptomyces sp. NPDC101191]|uniref:hypothetical protein n=1 Tax=Streptomyces sp. NPDC101191 TaxID=3366126 RepID=UPI0037FF3561
MTQPRAPRPAGPRTPPPAARPRTRPTGRRATGALPVELLLPPALDAFYTLHRSVYDAYARAHLDPPTAEATVRTTFGILAADWSYLLGEPNPTALAWDELVTRTGSRRHPLPGIPAKHPLRYDALVLTNLGHSPDAIAEATGRLPSTIRYFIAPHALRAENLLVTAR